MGADQGRERPDLAIEVVWTSGGIFPDLEMDHLCSFLDRPTALQALRAS